MGVIILSISLCCERSELHVKGTGNARHIQSAPSMLATVIANGMEITVTTQVSAGKGVGDGSMDVESKLQRGTDFCLFCSPTAWAHSRSSLKSVPELDVLEVG